MWQSPQRWLVEMIEVRVRQQHQINRRKVLDFQSCPLKPLQKEKPVRKIRVHQNIQVGELDQKRRMTDPRDRDLSPLQFWKLRLLVFPRAPREQRFPNQFPEKNRRTEMLRRRQVFERLGQWLAFVRWAMSRRLGHLDSWAFPNAR